MEKHKLYVAVTELQKVRVRSQSHRDVRMDTSTSGGRSSVCVAPDGKVLRRMAPPPPPPQRTRRKTVGECLQESECASTTTNSTNGSTNTTMSADVTVTNNTTTTTTTTDTVTSATVAITLTSSDPSDAPDPEGGVSVSEASTKTEEEKEEEEEEEEDTLTIEDGKTDLDQPLSSLSPTDTFLTSDLDEQATNSKHALKSLSRSTPAMSPSASPRHSDSEGQPRVSKGTKKFMRHFAEAPPGEWVLNYFSCALVSDILLQGTLYITQNYFGFYSKIFGHVSRLLIPVSQVAALQKERTAKIIPNAVGLQMMDGKNYVFGSLLSRDSTYKLMLHIWRKAQRMADSDSEPPSGVQVPVEDDGEDSASGSADSLMDQADGGFLVSSTLTTLTSLPPPSSSTTTAWTREEVTATTATTTATKIFKSENPHILPLNDGSIPVLSLASASNSAMAAVLQRGGPLSGKACTPSEETNGGTGASAAANTAAGSNKGSSGVNILEWITQGSIVKTCFKVGSVPMKLVGEGVKELWSLPRTSLLLLISTLLLLMLFASAAFMLHRVDVLSQQLGLERHAEYDSMYEEVLQMQQRLHAAASTEIEKTLNIQLKHIATVRQSLEALMVLFNKDFPLETAQIPDNT